MAGAYSVWDRLANKYDRLWVQKYSLTPTRRRVRQILSNRFHGENFTLLDLGCGTGQLLCEMREDSPDCRMLGVDKSPEMIRCANKRRLDIEFVCLDVDNEDLSQYFTESGFNAVTCCHSFPYYKNKPAVMAELYKLLDSEGIAVFAQASVNRLYDKTVLRVVEATAEKADYLSREAFRALAEKYFVIIEEFTIYERFYMPSICGFVLGKRL
ncbi:MAG: methyltransferase domain-containing protein [Clostridiales Family XIII bacterium]|nr:methyltransferase domain-containing protein [Clostridiales Family XIII bacterium]